MQRSLDRRKFLKLSAAGAAGGFLAGGRTINAASLNNHSDFNKSDIIHRTLGRTGMKLPVVNLGVMRVDNPRIVTMALDGGMTFLDTAHGYQNGRNEEMLGELLKNRPRDSFYIATKVGAGSDVSTERFMEIFDISMKRLQLEYVDILYLHAVSSREAVLNENHLAALTRLRKQGRTRFIGVTTHSNEPVVIRAAVESKEYDVVCPAINFTMENYLDIKQAVAEAAEAGLGVIAMKTMAGAYWDKERQDPINTKAALKFVLQNPNIHTSIPGVTAFHELEDNFEVNRDISLSPEEIKDLRLGEAGAGMYCFGCEQCIDQCPHKMPVPDMMRSYMYAYGYKDLALARSTMDSLGLHGTACGSCNSCSVKCVRGFNVAEKIRDIDRLRDIPTDFLA